MSDLRDPLRARLLDARRSGDRPVIAALRTALAAIDNAEAVPLPERSGGPSEVPRRELDAETVAALVRAEVADLDVAATTYDAAGEEDAAASARRGAAVLAEVLAAGHPADHLPGWKVMDKVSIMESRETAAQQLRDLERAEAAPYIDYPPSPRWYPPAVGLFGVAMFFQLYATLVAGWGGLLSGLTLLVLVGLELGFVYWYSRYHGAMPAIGRTPPVAEIRRVYGQFLLGFALLVVVLVAVSLVVGPLAGAIVTFVLVTGGIARYEHVYADAARAARERLV